MDAIIVFLGRDTFLALSVYIGCVIRAGKGEKVPPMQGLISAAAPFFVIMCILYLFEYGVGFAGLEMPAKPLASVGGLFGYLANNWLTGLQKDGKKIEELGAWGALVEVVKTATSFKKTKIE